MIVFGVDAASWKVIQPNLEQLPYWNNFVEVGKEGTLDIPFKPLSPVVWASIFSGVPPEKHKHMDFRKGKTLKDREDVPVEFIWDQLDTEIDVKALNIPFVVPPYSYNVEFSPAHMGFGVSTEELKEQTQRVYEKARETVKTGYDLFIVVFGAIDRLQHFHWGETPLLVKWYHRIGRIINSLIRLAKEDTFLIVSDHGFCDPEEAKVRTLPAKNRDRLKGDHSSKALYIAKNVRQPTSILDIKNVIKEQFTKKHIGTDAETLAQEKEKMTLQLGGTPLYINIPRFKKVVKQGGKCLCKKGVSCPCGEVLLMAQGKIDKNCCTCNVFYTEKREKRRKKKKDKQ